MSSHFGKPASYRSRAVASQTPLLSPWNKTLMATYLGWDIGGAHLKAALLMNDITARQAACPLWLGLEHFHAAARAILDTWQPMPDCLHAVTMTGELVDLFANREQGVFGLLQALSAHVPPQQIRVFAGPLGFLKIPNIRPEHVNAIASANWLATGYYAAAQQPQALLIDIGSTTTDLLLLQHGKVLTQGYTDYERLRYDELVYTGAVRTSLMALAHTAPLNGEWIGLMAEHFATTADIYRLTGELPEHADQAATADGAEKTVHASARRMARLLGLDIETLDAAAARRLALYFRERQLIKLTETCQRQLSRGLLQHTAPFIGAGVGRFLVQELARRLGHPYLDFSALFPAPSAHTLADCAPAVAVACLLARPTHD
jgi:probable H4MPT-linked C1 transfer pathway protein